MERLDAFFGSISLTAGGILLSLALQYRVLIGNWGGQGGYGGMLAGGIIFTIIGLGTLIVAD